MKKFMAVMLSACMAFSLCACGNTATERNSDATADNSEQTLLKPQEPLSIGDALKHLQKIFNKDDN